VERQDTRTRRLILAVQDLHVAGHPEAWISIKHPRDFRVVLHNEPHSDIFFVPPRGYLVIVVFRQQWSDRIGTASHFCASSGFSWSFHRESAIPCCRRHCHSSRVLQHFRTT